MAWFKGFKILYVCTSSNSSQNIITNNLLRYQEAYGVFVAKQFVTYCHTFQIIYKDINLLIKIWFIYTKIISSSKFSMN